MQNFKAALSGVSSLDIRESDALARLQSIIHPVHTLDKSHIQDRDSVFKQGAVILITNVVDTDSSRLTPRAGAMRNGW